ncbi:MAG: symmetrical bis(5'-nucleosyl)-tetraphosphatase [Pseudomonadota bacterium]|nr:symmetrical bis(5'-nucleosyl)-tetraphosphatase [Pseudomonadota bacterium]MDP1904713.1 symmetrical bis(5'-nucleosyl)-tetraphosphatase [Pseudomonadota bacterium]MDP2353614.1 symmetrical bis(5'-nucleosyl)-tetraphosphatase [Pseudomonadota bacterium]
MSTYVIGDIQGCHEALETLLASLNFDRARDRVWITGDLVNRGEDSLAVLRWCQAHDDCVVAVLGNHDLHLLAVAEGYVPAHRKDTLELILRAPDRDALLEWLRHRPMLHRQGAWLMVHAGLPPEWDADAAQRYAGELERALRGPNWRAFLKDMYGNEPRRWHPLLAGQERLRFIANALTRSRYLHVDGGLEFQHKLGLGTAPDDLVPWFDFPNRRSGDARILFGHWSTLGLLVREDVVALDTGCLWGGALTAFRLEDEQCFQVRCRARHTPKK